MGNKFKNIIGEIKKYEFSDESFRYLLDKKNDLQPYVEYINEIESKEYIVFENVTIKKEINIYYKDLIFLNEQL